MNKYVDLVLSNDKLFVGIALGVSAAAGAVVGYEYAKNKIYAEAEAEIAEMKEFFQSQMTEIKTATTNEVAKDAIDIANGIVERRNYQTPIREVDKPLEDDEVPPDVTITEENVFAKAESERGSWNQENEERNRTPNKPYIISKEEFVESALGEATELTYYSGDNVLVADDDEMPIPNDDEVVGRDNLNNFGHGSYDENVLYVRNERLGAEYEITLHPGKYSYEVAGFEHSEERHELRRFRDSD